MNGPTEILAEPRTVAGRANIECLLRPTSVAILGVSTKPNSPGQIVRNNLIRGGFAGDIYLVGRSGGQIEGCPILTSVDDLPIGIDLAILVLPADATAEAVAQCAGKGVKSAICFASGFAEMGEEGRLAQLELGRMAEQAGMALVGPNTVGYFNFIDSFHVMLIDLTAAPRLPEDSGRALAIVAQSGGIGAHLAGSLQARAVPISYMMTTGNEAHLGLADFIDHFAGESRTGGIVVYAEQIKDPGAFLLAAERARDAGIPVVMMHPGKSAKAQEAASSHTGALAGNHNSMRMAVEQVGVVVVDTLEELIDVGQLLLRFPDPQSGGLGVLTGSGAICAIALDYVEELGMTVPPLAERQAEALRGHLPAYTPPRNPLDLGTLVGWKPELMGVGAQALLADPDISSLLVSFPMADPQMSIDWMNSYLKALAGNRKPAVYVIHNEDKPLAPALVELIEKSGVVVMRSCERAMRALACVNRLAQARASGGGRRTTRTAFDLPAIGPGPAPEWQGKKILEAIGVPVPDGALARSADEAAAIANRIGYPVVMKAQAGQLTHKSDAGGVLLNLADEGAVRRAWDTLHANIERAQPGLVLDGALVETMGERGLELVVGAYRDANWGATVMIGLGGIWIEALGDVRLIPVGMATEAIVTEVRKLKAAKLLDGFRGSPPVDVEAVADVVARVSDLMVANLEIAEIDINPLVAYGRDKGVLALDALIVAKA